MKQNNFHVSIKTVDGTPLFPPIFKGASPLFPYVMQSALRTGVLPKGFTEFPNGVELVLGCKDQKQAREFADALCGLLYDQTNRMGYHIESLGIYIDALTNDERTLHAFMSDMVKRSMLARGINMEDVMPLDVRASDDQADDGPGLYSIDIDLNDLDNSVIQRLEPTKSGKKRHS
jgi:hypothetical protein